MTRGCPVVVTSGPAAGAMGAYVVALGNGPLWDGRHLVDLDDGSRLTVGNRGFRFLTREKAQQMRDNNSNPTTKENER